MCIYWGIKDLEYLHIFVICEMISVKKWIMTIKISSRNKCSILKKILEHLVSGFHKIMTGIKDL